MAIMALCRQIAGSDALDKYPFVLFDVGCSGGIASCWRVFEPYLVVHAFDPIVGEISRLKTAESNPSVHYYPAWVGKRKIQSSGGPTSGVSRWQRLSSAWATDILEARTTAESGLIALNQWGRTHLAPGEDTVSLCEFVVDKGVKDMDFVKIDVDGADFDILSASSCLFKDMSILGVKVEINYVGSDAPTENTFHNTDRLMRQSGYELVDLDVRRYSLRELPAPFVYRAPFHTKLGAPFQGDAVYARDVSWVPRGDDSYVAAKLLKLACVYEIAGVSDWAASLLIRNKSRLGKYCDVSALLDLLAQDKMSGVQGYNGFMQAFEHQPELLYPSAADEYCDRCRNRSKGSVLKVLIRRFVKACRKIYSAIPRVFS